MSEKNNKYPKTTSCKNSLQDAYDDDNIPEEDLPGNCTAEPLPESSRPRKDGPGGE